ANVSAPVNAVLMDSLHLIRAASEFADVLERDAQTASAAQLARTEEEVRRRQRDLQAAENERERKRAEFERSAGELLASAKSDAAEMRKTGERDANAAIR